ncbi:hypothetical protein SAMN05443252_102589 [Bacillus sp. OV322]|uniref:DUF2225 domain-containing protein n=1 Tax=Bacillus sp. OV322 TaxID=1882764 RepID=UPI0008E8C978|nr:DUF2225 domain-containing protein [Bacillus sp. OV322]SFC29219.1 hypothetical protein SAMN05443252_102589 [Bacillus sp. OV322]
MEGIQPLFDRKMECIYCQHKSSVKNIRSRFIKVSSYDTDFCPQYSAESENALLYNIHVCPNCGFSYSADFSPYFPPATRESIEDKICANWVPHDFGGERTIYEAIKTYKLASYCAVLKKEKHITIAGIYLRLAWLFRLSEDFVQEIRFMKLARQEYMNSYSTDDFKGTQVSEVKLLYLAGELSRRISDLPSAVRYFSMVIERQKQTTEPKIVEMAKERWQEIREDKKSQSAELIGS